MRKLNGELHCFCSINWIITFHKVAMSSWLDLCEKKTKSKNNIKVMELNKIKRTMARFYFCLSLKCAAKQTLFVFYVTQKSECRGNGYYLWILLCLFYREKKMVENLRIKGSNNWNCTMQPNEMKWNGTSR